MKHKILFIIILLLFGQGAFSQDIVKFIDGTEKKMKLVGSDEIVMILRNAETQETDTVEKTKIQEIIFANGEVLKVNKAKKKSENTISNNEESVKENSIDYELKNIAISTELIYLFVGKSLLIDFETFQKKTSLNFSFGKNFERSDFYLGGDFRFYFNNPEPDNFYLGNFDLGKGFVKFFASPGVFATLAKADSSMYDLSIPISLGLSFTLTSGAYIAIWAGPSYDMNFSTNKNAILPNFRISTGYRLNKKK